MMPRRMGSPVAATAVVPAEAVEPADAAEVLAPPAVVAEDEELSSPHAAKNRTSATTLSPRVRDRRRMHFPPSSARHELCEPPTHRQDGRPTRKGGVPGVRGER
jgi:hypothetical protein